ncbi:hypothetical protein [Micromonospora sp. WMMD1082]|nr:hypothetical protein [Micromonospora sp. WMMD1082]MDG4793076.1 hypothetical protein [Micromonospora sp. WMMD1082]
METVGVAGLIDRMNLLATWTPVVQAAYMCDEAAERWRKENGH